MVKYRVAVSDGGSHYPQYRNGGLFGFVWHYFAANADTSPSMLERLMRSDGPAGAAVFGTMQEAEDFIARVQAKSDAYYAAAAERRAQNAGGVTIKSTHNL